MKRGDSGKRSGTSTSSGGDWKTNARFGMSDVVVGATRGKTPKQSVLGQVLHKYSFLLLTSAMGLDIIISRLGYPYVGQILSSCMVVVYLLDFISLRRAVCAFWFAMMDLYFKEISVGGLHKLEALKDGRAVIFACAPHVNQFVDPIVVMKVVAETTGRHVSWMTAEKSMQRKWIGLFARALKGIPVSRPDDMERSGPGFITTYGTKVYGHAGTTFLKDFAKGSLLVVKDKGVKKSAKVASVIDDFNMILATPMIPAVKAGVEKSLSIRFERVLSPIYTLLILLATTIPVIFVIPPMFPSHMWPFTYMMSFFLGCAITNGIYMLRRDGFSGKELFGGVTAEYRPISTTVTSPKPEKKGGEGGEDGDAEIVAGGSDVTEKTAYRLQPYIDQTAMFSKVYDALLQGGTIGIFPEGGTHDGTQLLPLKWGISVMLLGAMARREGQEPLKISVVPVGLNYFAPHKFRSTVSIDFGDPIEVHQNLAIQWKNGTKEEKQEANLAVMELVMCGVNACTLQANDNDALEIFRTIRRLYTPTGHRLSVADNVALTQGFAQGFNKIKDSKEVKEIMKRTHEYNYLLSTYGVQDHHVQRFQRNAFSSRDRQSLIFKTFLRLLMLLVFGVWVLPWLLVSAPAALIISVVSDLKAKEVQKMSVKGTWKVLLSPVIMPLLHFACTVCIGAAFGEIFGLVWLYFAPVGAVAAFFVFEDAVKLMKSLNALYLLISKRDVGQKLYEFREELKRDIRKIKKDNNWLDQLDTQTRKRLENRQSFTENTDEYEKIDKDSFKDDSFNKN